MAIIIFTECRYTSICERTNSSFVLPDFGFPGIGFPGIGFPGIGFSDIGFVVKCYEYERGESEQRYACGATGVRPAYININWQY